ncbi:hypothetical protein GIB67_026914 [Kingdonia uniflora]|uniref:GDSL esterase/lipase n=1 Tax=Kingdonia uniflora TaxID=39325 RepID=A0A7J7P197_9MAGN|nr:hypothetical protein GIB67_026914 [Kingdonia uniflora]
MAHQCLTCLLFVYLLLLRSNVSAKVPSIIVFGDSTADAGNNNQINTFGKSNFGPYGRDFEGGKATGRFCNGRLFTDFISERFGIKQTIPAYLDPAYSIEDFASGVTFASAGSGYDNVTSQVLSVIPLWKQLDYFKEYQEKLTRFLGKPQATALSNEALYILSLGTNDFIVNYYVIPTRSSQFTAEEYQYFLLGIAETFIFDIYQLGARKIAITGLSPIGCFPLERSSSLLVGHACREDYNKVARDYNVKLQTLIASLNEKLSYIKLVFLNVYDTIQESIEKPYISGFENVAVGCCGTGTVELGPLLCNVGAKVPAVIVFGDSTVDAGNNNQINTHAKSNFRPYGQDFEGGKATGRFCNGRLFTDFISESFGLKKAIPAYLDPAYSIEDFACGVTFASAGTGYDNLTSQLVSVIPLSKELEYFKEYQEKLIRSLGKTQATALLNKALYILSIGTNDFIENYYVLPIRSSQFTIEEYQDFLLGIAEKFICDIHQLGAWKIGITGLPPMGCLPIERNRQFLSGRACNEEYNKVARDYNVKLQALIVTLNEKFSDIKLVYVNSYSPVVEVLGNPHIYGMENLDLGCLGTGTFELGPICKFIWKICEDPNKYAFWDAVHPSEKLYKIIADSIMRTDLAHFK